jgi:L-asparaginase II
MNDILVEVTRGQTVESTHRGAFCVMDQNHQIVMQSGDIDTPIFPRSSIKAIQALALLESGAADEYGFSAEEIALSCASHNGEVRHTAVATSMLHKMGLSKEQLQCGSHWPMNEEIGRILAMEGETPNTLHNNCSGKHSGFLAYLKHNKVNPTAYGEQGHPLQQLNKKNLEEVCEVNLDDAPVGIDGCAIPTWAIPLKNLAWGFARYSKPEDHFDANRSAAMKRITESVFQHPYMIAGKDRYDTRLMETFPNKAFVKVGAEGVFCGFIPEKGYGFAIKCDDGTFRGAEVILSALLNDLDVITKDDFEKAGVGDLYEQPLKNRNGTVVGVVRRAF